jgi:hypothetical protein
MTSKPPHGVETWSSSAWRERAVAWIDEQLDAGTHRSDDVEQIHLRPWATVLRVPTLDGPVWFKACGPGTAFEVALCELLARSVGDLVLTPIAADPRRGWMLLPDGGPTLGERLDGTARADALAAAIVEYGRLQRALMPRVDELLALGVADMRPSAMPDRFKEALASVAADLQRRGVASGGQALEQVAAMDATIAAWCERLGASTVAASLDHNDLHPWNVLGDGPGETRFYDWGDSVVAHPFAAMLVPFGILGRAYDGGLESPRFLRARDAYLGVFADLAPLHELAGTLELACRVAKIARALTWDRALQAARDQDEEVDDNWATAPLESLLTLLDDSYVGGA